MTNLTSLLHAGPLRVPTSVISFRIGCLSGELDLLLVHQGSPHTFLYLCRVCSNSSSSIHMEATIQIYIQLSSTHFSLSSMFTTELPYRHTRKYRSTHTQHRQTITTTKQDIFHTKQTKLSHQPEPGGKLTNHFLPWMGKSWGPIEPPPHPGLGSHRIDRLLFTRKPLYMLAAESSAEWAIVPACIIGGREDNGIF